MKKLLILLYLMTAMSYGQDLLIELEPYADGFIRPVDIKNAGDDRLFIVEQDGNIKIIANGSVLATPFLSLNVNSTGNEQGLLGLAFHPDYQNNGYFFVNYTLANGSTQISRFEVSSDPNIAEPTSELPILTVNQPFSNHNGGCLQFGPDGYLYIALGDGGSAGDPQNIAQNTSRLLGKMLRIDIDDTVGTQNYVIPPDNPFVGDSAIRDEIWATGLRNPWKFSFDTTTNELYIADVGQNDIEEINKVDAAIGGLNYGWRCYEGSDQFNFSQCADATSFTFPINEYSHTMDGLSKCSITGGYVYRGLNYPSLQGRYIFADFCSNEIGYINTAGDIVYTDPFSGNLSSFGEDQNKELYVAALNTGIIYSIIDPSLSLAETTVVAATLYPNPARSVLHIEHNHTSNTATRHFELYDISGRLVLSEKYTDQKHSVSVTELTAGVYFARTDPKSQAIKVIIQ